MKTTITENRKVKATNGKLAFQKNKITGKPRKWILRDPTGFKPPDRCLALAEAYSVLKRMRAPRRIKCIKLMITELEDLSHDLMGGIESFRAMSLAPTLTDENKMETIRMRLKGSGGATQVNSITGKRRRWICRGKAPLADAFLEIAEVCAGPGAEIGSVPPAYLPKTIASASDLLKFLKDTLWGRQYCGTALTDGDLRHCKLKGINENDFLAGKLKASRYSSRWNIFGA